jgi:hypothetical protein
MDIFKNTSNRLDNMPERGFLKGRLPVWAWQADPRPLSNSRQQAHRFKKMQSQLSMLSATGEIGPKQPGPPFLPLVGRLLEPR